MAGSQVVYRLRVSAHDLAVALGIETDFAAPVARAAFDQRRDALARYLADRLGVTAQGQPCAAAPPAVDGAFLPADLVLVLRYDCPVPVTRLGLRYGLFFDLDPTHRSLGKVARVGAAVPFVFDRSLHDLDLDVTAPGGAGRFGRVLWLGVEHLLTGYDHLLFLLALLIGTTRFAGVIAVVSAFTLAHSVTLALAWYGVLALPARLVEVTIAASIAWVAVQNVARPTPGPRWLAAGAFGLVHGLGFYGALEELGLEGGDVVTTLLAFNLGVEIGQVALVALAWRPLVWWARQRWYGAAARAASVAILVAALGLVARRVMTG